MIPSLSPLSDLGTAGATIAVPPPPSFRAPKGTIHNVTIGNVIEYERQRGDTSARDNGLRYEAKVQKALYDLLGDYYQPSPRVSFHDDSGLRFCIPDGLFRMLDRLVVFEIKIQHMPEAWWQLRKLYAPVLDHSFGAALRKPTQVIEVVASYDPAMPFPEPIVLISDLRRHLECEDLRKSFGVLVWKL